MTFIEEASKEFNMEPPLCEHTIRKCIEALPETSHGRSEYDEGFDRALEKCAEILERLINEKGAL